MQSQDVIDSPTPRTGAAVTMTRANDALGETLGNVMLWLIPVVAFLLAILSIR
jgi:cytochrome c-type biogenesis protein CcmH/NrfF